MQIELKISKKTLVVSLTGELDHHTAEQTRLMIEKTIAAKNIKNLIFDFSALSFMDSSGIGMVIGRYKLIRSLGGSVSLVCRGKRMERLVEMSGLTKLITVYNDVSSALSEVKEA